MTLSRVEIIRKDADGTVSFTIFNRVWLDTTDQKFADAVWRHAENSAREGTEVWCYSDNFNYALENEYRRG